MGKKSVPPASKPAFKTAAAEPAVDALPAKLMQFRQVPQVGTTVQYTVTDGQCAGAVRAAIITATFHQPGWEDDPDKVCWEVNLTLFPNQSSPALHEETYPPQVPYNEDANERRTWRFVTCGIAREVPDGSAALPPAPENPANANPPDYQPT